MRQVEINIRTVREPRDCPIAQGPGEATLFIAILEILLRYGPHALSRKMKQYLLDRVNSIIEIDGICYVGWIL